MVKLNAFTAILPLIALLPAFQGSIKKQPGYIDFDITFHMIPRFSDTTGNTPKPELTSFFIKKYEVLEIKKKLSCLAKGLTIDKVRKRLFGIMDQENKMNLSEEDTLWTQKPVSSNSSSPSEFVRFKSDNTDLDIRKIKTIAILVREVEATDVTKNINKWLHPKEKVRSDTNRFGVNRKKNNNTWSWKKIVGYSGTGIFVTLCIGSIIYYFFVPTKEASSSLLPEEEGYEEL